MYVCVCNSVTDRDIRAAADRGVSSMRALGDQLKVGTCCGRCTDCARRILDETVMQGGQTRLENCPAGACA
jgi:bacterioferritin-associated ferredoxin